MALLRLPLPPGVTPDQYEVAPYRWTGRLWERVTARDVTGGVQFGVNEPGTFALLGHWRLADATVALVKPDTAPGQQSIPLTVVGQYRYSAIPPLQDGLVPAQLVLKQDSSGGAGLVAGDPDQDKTVDQTTLYFKPDPAKARALIEFQHVFDLAPGLLNLDPGRQHPLLPAADGRRLRPRRPGGSATGVEYTQVLPIHIENMEVVRPVVLQEDRVQPALEDHAQRPDFPDARGARARAGAPADHRPGRGGRLQVVLEVEQEGEWMPISNELSVQLAAAPDRDPGARHTPTATPALVAVDTPGAIPPPAVPTRRPTPAGGGNVARITPTPVVTATATAAPIRRRRRGPTGPASSGPTSTPWHRASARTSTGRWRT